MITVFHRCATYACGDALGVPDAATAYWWAMAMDTGGWHLSIAGPIWPGQREAILAEIGETERDRLARHQDELAEAANW